MQALIDGYKQNLYLYPNGDNRTIDISTAIAVTSASRIQCSKEQYDMYCDMGTSFQLCKICSENNKDRRLEPCGHLICSTCLENWQEHNNVPSCPFCRCEIKTFEPIIISPSDKNQKSLNQKVQYIWNILNLRKSYLILFNLKEITNEKVEVASTISSNSSSFIAVQSTCSKRVSSVFNEVLQPNLDGKN